MVLNFFDKVLNFFDKVLNFFDIVLNFFDIVPIFFDNTVCVFNIEYISKEQSSVVYNNIKICILYYTCSSSQFNKLNEIVC